MPVHARLLERVAFMGAVEGDPENVRDQKAALTLAVVVITVLPAAWVGTYLALGLPVSAAIPLAYQVFAVVSLVLLARIEGARALPQGSSGPSKRADRPCRACVGTTTVTRSRP